MKDFIKGNNNEIAWISQSDYPPEEIKVENNMNDIQEIHFETSLAD